ncbi:unnamed protein product [Peronospora belbahrii]|uniref:NADH-ubiquinone oxidoreductase 21kDa subunit N-terminal domain-containing protein n=1 Tax=Peronospora belbahrii TaxID=622444 RepID=A0AAU9LRQ1_9STRA|nr:unnamed protein product [Peronospora belbahrii]CAH0520882.1 unnamed protein product [Peronospora belbahrii]
MSFSAFVAGMALGGLRYGMVKFKLLECESVVMYSVNQVTENFHGHDGHRKKTHNQSRYESLPSHEHEYYTYIRQGWNSKVMAFRHKVYELFEMK